jgi:hypothetical protein
MVLRNSRLLLVAGALAATWTFATTPAEAGHPAAAPLFANYYAQGDGATAQMYLCPRPTPPLVGHTWITYQPLMPHEFLYTHRRSYVTVNPGARRTVTYVRWGHDPIQGLIPYYVDGHVLENLLNHGN